MVDVDVDVDELGFEVEFPSAFWSFGALNGLFCAYFPLVGELLVVLNVVLVEPVKAFSAVKLVQ